MRRAILDSFTQQNMKKKTTISQTQQRKKTFKQAPPQTRLLRFDKRNRSKTALSSFRFYYYAQQTYKNIVNIYDLFRLKNTHTSHIVEYVPKATV